MSRQIWKIVSSQIALLSRLSDLEAEEIEAKHALVAIAAFVAVLASAIAVGMHLLGSRVDALTLCISSGLSFAASTADFLTQTERESP